MIQGASFRRELLAWYDHGHRDLPWRQSNDFYRVWISEIMLQQTRVEAVIPYYERFLALFPDIEALAGAPEADVLAAWSGLGYYSRARNLQATAKRIVLEGLPASHADILALPGIGAYTAAAVASIALGEAHAAVDGNVIRVVSRLTNDASEVSNSVTRRRFAETAQSLLDPKRPGDFNQAMMELGATVCLPANPKCLTCPVACHCAARAAGTQTELPVRLKKGNIRELELHLILLMRGEEIFLVQRKSGERRMAGFWELPERALFPALKTTAGVEFTHQIVNDRFRICIWKAHRNVRTPKTLPEGRWFARSSLRSIPLATITRKGIDRSFTIGP